MANVLPRINVTDSRRPGSPYSGQITGITTSVEGPLTNKKLASKVLSPTSPTTPLNEVHNDGSFEGRRPSDVAIDPLSQQILQRTNTSPAVHKLRQNAEPNSAQSPTANEGFADKKNSAESPRDGGGVHKAEKKKGVSFLSRFIGTNKKKGLPDSASDNGAEADDLRPEGMDAQVYVDNFGFRPKVPQSPAYIKVRSRFKKKKEFDRVFLAQILRTGSDRKSQPAAGSNPAPQSGSAATQNPIWAVEFSKDGRFLAAGGQDRVVRVWAVISSPEDRHFHETEEGDPTSSGEEEKKRLSAPVFQHKTLREYTGHTSTILDLSWSKNNFLLSSSMDKTVRLWHVSRDENLCTFKHSDFVPSIQFHPTDDRFFLAGSLDAKLRLWSIPDKNIAFSVTVPDMITAVSFTPDGKTCIAGTLGGLCMFYDTEGLKWQAQLHVKSTRGQNAKGSKITGIQATHWPGQGTGGEVKLLVSSNDSRVRVYNYKDKALEMKFRGHENNSSQIRASFASSGHIICGSEDRKAYIWSTTAPEGEKGSQRPLEMFEAHNSITTCTVIAPVQTRQLLSASEDPIYDLCNPPPVTLVSRAESVVSSRAPTEAGSALPTPAHSDFPGKKASETPAYLARCAHHDGNIIVTADFTGALKVFRQDCAFVKRLRMSEAWESSSLGRAGSKLGRPSSILSRTSRSRRDSISTQPPNDRIMTWRQGISHGSFDSSNSLARRSASPRKSLARLSQSSFRPPDSPSMRPTQAVPTINAPTPEVAQGTPKTSTSVDDHTYSKSPPESQPSDESSPSRQDLQKERTKSTGYRHSASPDNPMAVFNGQSWNFWTRRSPTKTSERPSLDPRTSELSQTSQLTSELSDEGLGEAGRCRNCGKGLELGNKSTICKECEGKW